MHISPAPTDDRQIFASIDDYRSSRIVVGEFKTNHFVDAYKQNTEVLTSIKNGAPLAYHDIMHGLFVRVTYVSLCIPE